MRSSASSTILPLLLAVVSVIGAERMGSASWISGERIATSRAISDDVVAASPPAVLSTTSYMGSGAPSAASRASGVNLCIGTPAGMSPPSAPVKRDDKCISAYDYSSWSPVA
jgi:hypothetical protein